MGEVVALVGVYHADGGLLGELRYVVGKLLHTAHCSLCDITHSPVRRKPAWDAMVARLGVPITLLHLNELPDDVAAAVASSGSPVLLARLEGGALAPLLGAETLDALGGSVAGTEEAIRAALADRSWVLARAASA